MIDPNFPPELFYALGAAGLAFVPKIRREILKDGKYTCQAEKCFGEYMGVGRLQFQDGFMIQAAHYPPLHQPFPDTDKTHGRNLCTTDHILEHIEMGSPHDAFLNWTQQPIRSRIWFGNHGYDIEKDINLMNSFMKMGFEWYVDFVEADENGRIGLAEAYKERWHIA